MFACPKCKTLARVTETRPLPGGVGVRRRNKCPRCQCRFTTHETLAPNPRENNPKEPPR